MQSEFRGGPALGDSAWLMVDHELDSEGPELGLWESPGPHPSQQSGIADSDDNDPSPSVQDDTILNGFHQHVPPSPQAPPAIQAPPLAPGSTGHSRFFSSNFKL